LALSTTEERNAFLGDLGAAQAAGRTGIVSTRATSNDKTWTIWARFCADLHVDPWLSNIDDPIILLQVFGHRYRTGMLSPSKRPVKSRTVEGALRAVGQTFSGVGADDPRLTSNGKQEFRLRRQLTGYARGDPPPNRVKPIPLQVIYHLVTLAQNHASSDSLAVSDLIIIAFFFLMRPGEYTAPTGDNTPFRMTDIQFYIGNRRVSANTTNQDDLSQANFVTFTFTTQKNCVRNEVIGLGRSGNPYVCPVTSTARRIQHLRQHSAPPTAPLCTYYANASPHYVTSSDITSTLQASVRVVGPNLGFLPNEVSARSLRAAGAMALLCAHVDSDTIRLLGRWRSDVMLRYLTVQAQPVMRDFSRRMLTGGDYLLLPNQDVPEV
jgi:hypothetical protein